MNNKNMNSPVPLPPAKVDVAVLILFFNRPECLEKVFAEVRQARPSRLFLYQDGPRDERDLPGIMASRRVVEHIDWQCDVRRSYQTENQGVDPSNYKAQRWAFSMADKCIVFEDDSIPSQTFLPFCKEMLDRYEHDERIGMVAGFNTDEQTTDAGPDSYFFTSVFSIWGWASWRRVVDRWDPAYAFLDSPDEMRRVKAIMRERRYVNDTLRACYSHRASSRDYYETIFWAEMLLEGRLAIMPSQNMISNLGPMAAGAAHFQAELKTLPRAQRRLFLMGRYDLDFPLRHPQHVVEHVAYKERYLRRMAYGHPWIKVGRSMEELWLNLIHGNYGNISRALRRRIDKWTGRFRHS